MDDRAGPKYVVTWQTEFDAEVTPQQAGIEALRGLKARDVAVHVTDCDTNRQWDVCFRDHVLEIVEVRVLWWDKGLGELVKEPIKRWDSVLEEYVPVEEGW
jgi:hypothetical protein